MFIGLKFRGVWAFFFKNIYNININFNFQSKILIYIYIYIYLFTIQSQNSYTNIRKFTDWAELTPTTSS